MLNVSPKDTKLAEHKLEEALLGFNPTSRVVKLALYSDPLSFRAVEYTSGWFSNPVEIVERTASQWHLCRPAPWTYLSYCPPGQWSLSSTPLPKNLQVKRAKGKCIMKRKRRKLNACISTLRANSPMSPLLLKLLDEINSLAYKIKELIDAELKAKENRAISKIKINSRYFFTYAKQFAKVHLSVAPIKDQNCKLQTDPSRLSYSRTSTYLLTE